MSFAVQQMFGEFKLRSELYFLLVCVAFEPFCTLLTLLVNLPLFFIF